MGLSDKFCPGSIRIREPVPEDIPCPRCGELVEIWSDERRARCPRCRASVTREMDLSCVQWCRYAQECIGEEAYQRLKGEREG